MAFGSAGMVEEGGAGGAGTIDHASGACSAGYLPKIRSQNPGFGGSSSS
jgi:hypothetical protein